MGHAEQLLFSCLGSKVTVYRWIEVIELSWFPAKNYGDKLKKHKWKVLSKKTIDIFNLKQRHLSIDIKTKVVQHVPRIIFNVFKVFKFQVFKFSFQHFCLLWKCNLRKLVSRSLGTFIGFALDKIPLVDISKHENSFQTHLNCCNDTF